MTAANKMLLLEADNTLLDNGRFAAMRRIASQRATLADRRSQEPRR